MDFQLIIVCIAVAVALFYVGRTMYKSAKGGACQSGSCGCDANGLHKAKS